MVERIQMLNQEANNKTAIQRNGSMTKKSPAVQVDAEDPFGLFGEVSRRAVSTKRRRAFAGDGQVVGAETMPLYEAQHAPVNRANSGKNKGARETFYMMSPKHRETQVEKYTGEDAHLLEEDEKRD